MEFTFVYLESLMYLNLRSFTDESLIASDDMFSDIYNNLIYCINKTKAPSIVSKMKEYYLYSSYSFTNNCSDTCFLQPSILLINEKKCISCYELNPSFKFK